MLTAYLDMANWIDLADRRVDPSPFERAIRRRRIVAVLSLPHLLELASIKSDAWRERLARYMNFIDSIGRIKWVRHPYEVMRMEAIACFNRNLSTNLRHVADSV